MKVLILEDEALAADKLESTLLELEPLSEIVAKLPSVMSAIAWFRDNPHPDLLLSDIRLLDGLCFELFEKVTIDIPVIFTTAYDQYAIKAFQVNSIDYLLKPVQKEKLRKSLAKLKARAPGGGPSPADFHAILKYLQDTKTEYKSRFMVRSGQKIVAIPSERIAYFFSENKLTFLVTREGKRFTHDQPLEELVEVLDPRMFFRANRQYIVTFESIAEIHPYFKGRVTLTLYPGADHDVVVSAERTPEFKKWIDQ